MPMSAAITTLGTRTMPLLRSMFTLTTTAAYMPIDWREFMAKYAPDGDIRDQNYVFGYNFAMALEHVLKAAGNDLSPENIHKQAYSIRDLELPMLLPGIEVNTTPDNHVPLKQMQFMRFDGKQWERFGEILTAN